MKNINELEIKQEEDVREENIRQQMENQELEIALLEEFLRIRKQLETTFACTNEDIDFLEEHQERILENYLRMSNLMINHFNELLSQPNLSIVKIKNRYVSLEENRCIPDEWQEKFENNLIALTLEIESIQTLIRNFIEINLDNLNVFEYMLWFNKFVKYINESSAKIKEIGKDLQTILDKIQRIYPTPNRVKQGIYV